MGLLSIIGIGYLVNFILIIFLTMFLSFILVQKIYREPHFEPKIKKINEEFDLLKKEAKDKNVSIFTQVDWALWIPFAYILYATNIIYNMFAKGSEKAIFDNIQNKIDTIKERIKVKDIKSL